VNRQRAWFTACAGLFAGIGASSSLLTAAAALVFLAWILYFTDAGDRTANFIVYIAAAAVPLAPVFWL